MKKVLSVLLLLITSCGVTVHSDPIKVQPITVNHNINLNMQQLLQFYEAICSLTFTNPDDLEKCKKDKTDEFLSALSVSTLSG